MKNILKFEFHKLFRQKSFYVCSAIMVVFSVIGIMITKSLAENNPELITGNLSGLSALLSAITSANFIMISGIFIALFVCTDHDNQTIKNIYSRGFSKTKVYISKLIVCLCAVIVMLAITLGVSYISGASTFGNELGNGNYLALILGQIPLVIAYSTLVFAISSIFRKVGTSIALAILGPSLINTVLNLLDSMLKTDKFKLSSYWLDSFTTDLTALTTSTTRLIICAVICAVYTVIFISVGLYFSKKQEN